MPLRNPIDRFWRRRFGSFTIDDPRTAAAEAPFTFFLPSAEQLSAILPGDEVKLIIRSIPASARFDAERMWVKVTAIAGEQINGELDNDPLDMPQLKPGTPLTFQHAFVIDILWQAERDDAPPPPPVRREYWERCMVDDCVLGGRSAVDYLYRETPDLAQPDDKYPDSGWRIRGTEDGISEDKALGVSPGYVAIGAVLNRDDSWLHLVDRPVGSRFIRDPQSGRFELCDDDQ